MESATRRSTPHRSVIVLPDAASVAEHAAATILADIDGARDSGRPFSLCLSGGSTPQAIYRILREKLAGQPSRIAHVHFFWGDERSVPATSPDSNVGAARREFLDPLGVSPDHIHAPDGGSADLSAAARLYDADIRRCVSTQGSPWPVFDLLLLGFGADGHTASLFPGTTALGDTSHCYVANEVPRMNTWRLTATFPVLRAAHRILILGTGSSKAPIVQAAFAAEPVAIHPVLQIAAGPERELWIVDREAAAGS